MTSIASAQEVQRSVIRDVRGEIFEEGAQIVVEANCDIDCLDYVLENPTRIVIDPIGKVYSDLKETISFAEGPVKKITITKGRPEEGMSGDYYPLDFISIEVDDLGEYKVRKEVKNESYIVDIGRKKVAAAAPPAPATTEEAAPAPAKEEAPIPLGEKVHVTIEPPAEAQAAQAQQPIPLAAPPQQEALAAPAEAVQMVYAIGEGDTLDISVWQHMELDRTVIVRPDGYISFPLVGDILAKGTTPPQLSTVIRENLSRLIKDPRVTVIVSGFGSKNIFVLGEVGKPGSYPYRGGMNILDAVSQAGGWKNSAVLSSVMLVRKAFTQAPEVQRLNVYTLVRRGDFSQNRALEPGDIVYIPKSFIANIGGFMDNLRMSLGASASVTQTYTHD